MRYVYLGHAGTDPLLRGAECDPIRDPKTGKCVVGRGNALVRFAVDDSVRVVARRRLRLKHPTAVLYIDRFSSACGACGLGTDPYAKRHERVMGYRPGIGCGALFDRVASNYADYDGRLYDRIREMRPDLPFEGGDAYRPTD